MVNFMAKINYTKVESVLSKTLNNMFLQNISELSAVAIQAREGNEPLNTEEVDKILKTFRAELKKLKKHDTDFYQQLELTPELEKRLLTPSRNFTREDWLKLIELKDRMIEINSARAKSREITQEDEDRVARERAEHVNKRFNVRKGWLPLH